VQHVKLNDFFTDYLMFQSAIKGAIPVSVSVLNWAFSTSASHDLIGPYTMDPGSSEIIWSGGTRRRAPLLERRRL